MWAVQSPRVQRVCAGRQHVFFWISVLIVAVVLAVCVQETIAAGCAVVTAGDGDGIGGFFEFLLDAVPFTEY